MLSFLDKISLARAREVNHFWKRHVYDMIDRADNLSRLASDDVLWKYHSLRQAERHKSALTLSLDVAYLSHGSWMTLHARRECFIRRSRCTECFAFVISGASMMSVPSLELYCCRDSRRFCNLYELSLDGHSAPQSHDE